MPKRLTPLERAIEGESADRRVRYVQRLEKRGLTYVRVVVPVVAVDRLKGFAHDLVQQAEATDSSVASDND